MANDDQSAATEQGDVINHREIAIDLLSRHLFSVMPDNPETHDLKLAPISEAVVQIPTANANVRSHMQASYLQPFVNAMEVMPDRLNDMLEQLRQLEIRPEEVSFDMGIFSKVTEENTGVSQHFQGRG